MSVPRAMLPPALTAMLPPPVVRLPSAATLAGFAVVAVLMVKLAACVCRNVAVKVAGVVAVAGFIAVTVTVS